MDMCPHGLERRTSAIYVHTPVVAKSAPKTIWVSDASECPACLSERVERADKILMLVFISPNSRWQEAYEEWRKYIQDYNP